MTRPDPALADAVATALGRRPTAARPLPGGCIAEVLRFDFDRGAPVVAKRAAQGGLDTEAFMLAVLAARSELPVPALLHADDTLLLMELVPGRTGLNAAAQRDAAHHLAALHAVRGPAFGLERDTLIGPLHQPNPQAERWIDFFRDRRLLYAADRAQQAGNLTAGQRRTLDRLAA
jgi:fructosamine-3-kinase